jgi:hypothetical protein
MYLMHNIPQTSFLNPAVQINCRWFLGIPGLSSTHVAYGNTAFTYLDLAEGDTWNLEKVERQTHRVDLYGSELSMQILALGYRHTYNYFTFSVDDRAHLYQAIPGELVSTLVKGNYPLAGDYSNFSALRSYGTYLRQYTLGVSRVLSRSLKAGVRIKLLFGKADISVGRSDISLSTAEDNFDLLAHGNYRINASLPLTVVQNADGHITGITWNEVDYLSFLLNRRNPGIAMDFGLIYKYDPKLTLSASLLDVGALRWRTDLNNINSTGTFVYDEIEGSGDVISTTFLDELIDTLQSAFDVTVSQQAFTSLLPAQVFLGASYQLREDLSLGLVSRNILLRSKLYSSLTLSASTGLTRHLRGTLSWSYLNRSIRNIGAVLALQGEGFQFHLATDNLIGFMQPFDTRTLNFRMGFNVLFGCPRDKKEELEAASYGPSPIIGNCNPTEKEKRGKLKYKKLRDR